MLRALGLSSVAVLLACGTPIAAQNLATNGNFDSSTVGWTAGSTISLSWDRPDSQRTPGSGSALAANTVPGANSGVTQCIEAGPIQGVRYDLRVSVRVPSGQSNTG